MRFYPSSASVTRQPSLSRGVPQKGMMLHAQRVCLVHIDHRHRRISHNGIQECALNVSQRFYERLQGQPQLCGLGIRRNARRRQWTFPLRQREGGRDQHAARLKARGHVEDVVHYVVCWSRQTRTGTLFPPPSPLAQLEKGKWKSQGKSCQIGNNPLWALDGEASGQPLPGMGSRGR